MSVNTVRLWLNSKPGVVTGSSPRAAMDEAFRKFRADTADDVVTREEFEDLLRALRHDVWKVRVDPPTYAVALPSSESTPAFTFDNYIPVEVEEEGEEEVIDAQTVLLANFNGENGQQSYNDETGGLGAFTFLGGTDKESGNDVAVIDTAVKKFGVSSLFLHSDILGVDGGSLRLPYQSVLDFEAGQPFTMEAWILTRGFTDEGTIFNQGRTNNVYWYWQIENGASAGLLRFVFNNGVDDTFNLLSAAAITLNVFNHVAVTRDAFGVWRQFINGVLDENTATEGAAIDTSSDERNFYIGSRNAGAARLDLFQDTANIDSVRITRGYARYTESFDLPTEPFGNDVP